ncbi:unnamed protein product [Amoebophrya sp. A120]|nr:unnamed protein product [Amoebophrya sp. A120]|eukprot:GSA120T00022627001.1
MSPSGSRAWLCLWVQIIATCNLLVSSAVHNSVATGAEEDATAGPVTGKAMGPGSARRHNRPSRSSTASAIAHVRRMDEIPPHEGEHDTEHGTRSRNFGGDLRKAKSPNWRTLSPAGRTSVKRELTLNPLATAPLFKSLLLNKATRASTSTSAGRGKEAADSSGKSVAGTKTDNKVTASNGIAKHHTKLNEMSTVSASVSKKARTARAQLSAEQLNAFSEEQLAFSRNNAQVFKADSKCGSTAPEDKITFDMTADVRWICDQMTTGSGANEEPFRGFLHFERNGPVPALPGVPPSQADLPVTHRFVICKEFDVAIQACTVGHVCNACQKAMASCPDDTKRTVIICIAREVEVSRTSAELPQLGL